MTFSLVQSSSALSRSRPECSRCRPVPLLHTAHLPDLGGDRTESRVDQPAHADRSVRRGAQADGELGRDDGEAVGAIGSGQQ